MVVHVPRRRSIGVSGLPGAGKSKSNLPSMKSAVDIAIKGSRNSALSHLQCSTRQHVGKGLCNRIQAGHRNAASPPSSRQQSIRMISTTCQPKISFQNQSSNRLLHLTDRLSFDLSIANFAMGAVTQSFVSASAAEKQPWGSET